MTPSEIDTARPSTIDSMVEAPEPEPVDPDALQAIHDRLAAIERRQGADAHELTLATDAIHALTFRAKAFERRLGTVELKANQRKEEGRE